MGHEVVGTDPDGRRVAINPLVACGTCDSVHARRSPTSAVTRALLGVQRPGGYAERVVATARSLHRLPG